MPLFEISDGVLTAVERDMFSSEKELQTLIEANLETVFNCRFIASEFWTGSQHAGRIDTLALSEENNPVIIEYKWVESSELINQSLFYLHWLADHRGDFELAARKALGDNAEIDWSDIRVICIAPNYRKYDLYAVQMMGANIELWKYRLYANGILYFEEVYRDFTPRTTFADGTGPSLQRKKEGSGRTIGVYTFDEHVKDKATHVKDLAIALQDYILSVDPAMEEMPRKNYIAYRMTQNIVCMEVQMQRILLFLKLDPKGLGPLPNNARDVSRIGHYGTGDLELSIRTENEFEAAKMFIEQAYTKVGG